MAELYFSEEICLSNKEKRGPWIEDFATKQGHTIFSYDMHCIETMMFPHIPKKNI